VCPLAAAGKEERGEAGDAAVEREAGRVSGSSAWTVRRHDFTIEFLYGQGDDPAVVDNLDAWIHLSDGTVRYATFITPAGIAEILRRRRGVAQAGGGRYFWASDLVIVPVPGVNAMVAAAEEMIRSGDIEFMCGVVDRVSSDPAGER
jgi:hypothetical protein